jgi:16S rRNA (adenine1518-N6/adenine1519-N6)-dimethyltransferase
MGRPKRHRLGQNFLVDRDVAERIAGALASEPQQILEIGPGRGALTEPLLERFGKVLALELDDNLVPQLQQRFGGRGIDIRSGDALREDLDDLLAAKSPWQVAANLPYSVGTAILRRFLPRHDLFTRVVVMLQREVAHRVVAAPGGSGHGLLALERAAWGEARFLFDVPPRAFRPVPKVMSSVIVVDLRPPDFAPEAIKAGLALAAHALTKPRKMLSNAAAPLRQPSDIERSGLDPAQRPGTVELEGWIRLSEQP